MLSTGARAPLCPHVAYLVLNLPLNLCFWTCPHFSTHRSSALHWRPCFPPAAPIPPQPAAACFFMTSSTAASYLMAQTYLSPLSLHCSSHASQCRDCWGTVSNFRGLKLKRKLLLLDKNMRPCVKLLHIFLLDIDARGCPLILTFHTHLRITVVSGQRRVSTWSHCCHLFTWQLYCNRTDYGESVGRAGGGERGMVRSTLDSKFTI